jgi:hypothetical protein
LKLVTDAPEKRRKSDTQDEKQLRLCRRLPRMIVKTIDRVAQQFDLLARLALPKIDIAGHEIECLKGAERMFRGERIDNVLVEVGFLGGTGHTPLSLWSSLRNHQHPEVQKN